MPKLPRINAASLIRGVQKAQSKEEQRALPTSKGGEARTFQQFRTDVSSYFTVPSSQEQLVYAAENWVRVKVTLETAGPVAIGTSSQIAPVLSGRGRLLDTGVEYEIYCARGTRVYVASESVNRLSFTVEPIPWMEQISGEIVMAARTISVAVKNVSDAIVAAIGQLTGASPTAPPPPQPLPRMEDLPTPKLPMSMAARLTRVVPPRKVR